MARWKLSRDGPQMFRCCWCIHVKTGTVLLGVCSLLILVTVLGFVTVAFVHPSVVPTWMASVVGQCGGKSVTKRETGMMGSYMGAGHMRGGMMDDYSWDKMGYAKGMPHMGGMPCIGCGPNGMPHGEDMPGMRRASVNDMPHMKEMPSVKDMPHMKDVAKVEDMPHMKDVPWMKDMPHMKDVPNVEDMPHMKEMPSVKDMPHMKDVAHVEDMPHMKDVPWMKDMPHMKDVPSVKDMPHMKDVAHVGDMPHMKDVPWMKDMPHVKDMPSVKDMPHMKDRPYGHRMGDMMYADSDDDRDLLPPDVQAIDDSNIMGKHPSLKSEPCLDGDDKFFLFVVLVCCIAASVMLINGVIRGFPSYMMPYMGLQVFDFCITGLLVFTCFSYVPGIKRSLAALPDSFPGKSYLMSFETDSLMLLVVLVLVMVLVIKAYFLGVVWSCYKFVTQQQSNSRSHSRTAELDISHNPEDTELLLPPKYEDIVTVQAEEAEDPPQYREA